jgi:hypothetical protein
MISLDQNSDRGLMRLAAQRQRYADAKTVFACQLMLSGPVAMLSAFLSIQFPELKGLAASWALVVVLVDLFLLSPWQKRMRDDAARIQELFDCDVLGLQWNEVKAGKRPPPELVKEQADRYKLWEHKMPPLKDWYASDVDSLPVHIGRIACQRANCWWDAKQRRHYSVWVVISVVAIFVAAILYAVARQRPIDDFFLLIAAPLAPLLLTSIRHVNDQFETAARLDKLKDHSESLWNDALKGAAKTQVTTRSRSLQDEILDNRRKSPMVFDFIFSKLRPKMESQMNFGISELVTEAKSALKLG